MSAIYGQLIKPQMENLASDPSTPSNGLFYFNTVSNFPKYYNSAAWRTFVDDSSPQVITSKDYDGGTASNTSRVTIPKATKATLDGLTRKQGTLWYATDFNKYYGDDGTQLRPIGSGSGGAGGKNYIGNPDDIGNWATSGAGVTIATTTTAADLPEVSKGSGILITGVSGTDYAYFRFTLDAGDKVRPGWLSTYIKTLVGYSAGDFKFELYSNSASNYGGSYTLLTVLPGDIAASPSSAYIVDQFTFSTADYFELRVTRVSGTSSIVLSGVSLGPSTLASNVIVTPWQDVGTGGISLTYVNLGTVTEYSKWRRVGDSIQFQGFTSVGTPVAATARFSIDGLNIDLDKVSANAGASLGVYTATTGSTQNNFMGQDGILFLDVANPNLIYFSQSTTAGAFDKADATSAFAASQSFGWQITLPILEWSGSGTTALGTPGEVVSSSVTFTSLPGNVVTDVATLVLTPGEWDLYGNVGHLRTAGGVRTVTYQAVGFSLVSATLPSQDYTNIQDYSIVAENIGLTVPTRRLSVSVTTTVYVVLQVAFNLASDVYGQVYARRSS